MLFSDLALILTIMINTLILHQSSEAGIIEGKGRPNFYPQGILKHFNYLDANEKIPRLPGKNGRTNKTYRGEETKEKMRQRKWYLDPVVLKLAIVVDKYDKNKSLIETIYSGVTECGLNKCEKFKKLIPEDQLMNRVKCFKDNFEKMILNKLIKFHRGVQIIEKTFQYLISYEETPGFSNTTRRNFLKKLEIDIKMLNVEIKSVMTNKRLSPSQQPETFASSSLLRPDSETHLRINEWRIIQDTKQFLRDWKENFDKIFKCWKKRRQKKRRKRKRLSKSSPTPTIHQNFLKFEEKEKSGNHFL